ncbi:hypothetical protein [Nonomuraea aurantiaca]|uniref:hypothetical protein n=1 Tax=Nonomuraea aurantiaca TaxID=2878562 RepID=UPI001CD9A85F|nr:hypothetical protein [Nonomuraea aurantiaca]MCA2220016.1 hypothetical protein [Nonomuraea aurantiaca]
MEGLAGLGGVFVGVWLTYWLTVNQRHLAMTFELHKELHGPEMIRARYTCADILMENPGLTYDELDQHLGYSTMGDLRQIIYFFQRLWLSIEHGEIRKKYVCRLFGDTYSWWYKTTLEANLVPNGSEVAKDLEALWNWMNKNSTSEQRRIWRGSTPSHQG